MDLWRLELLRYAVRSGGPRLVRTGTVIRSRCGAKHLQQLGNTPPPPPPPRFYHHNTRFHFFLLLQNLLVGPTTQLLLSLVILRKYLNCHSKNLAVSSSTVYTPSPKSQQTPKNHSKHIPSCRDLTNNSNWYFLIIIEFGRSVFFTSYNNRYLPLDMNNFRTMFSDLRKINDNDKK